MKMMMYFPSLFQVQYLLPAFLPQGGFFLPEICPVTMGHRRRVTSGATQGICVLVNGLEPLPIRLQGDCSTIGAKPAYLAGPRGLEPSSSIRQVDTLSR